MYEGTNNHLRILGIVEVIYGVIHVAGFLALSLIGLAGCGGCIGAESAGDALGHVFGSMALSGGALIGALLFAGVSFAGLALMNGRS
jgi:hypothetical protein